MRAYRIAYDGRPYHGFQRQPDVRTVEGTLFESLGALGITDGGKPAGYAAAGRTDAGVSALAQTVAFEAPEWLTPAALNSELPADVRAWASAEAPTAFHATHDATRRRYTYWLHGTGLDVERARAALAAVSGRHDFHNLTTGEANTVRELDASMTEATPFFRIAVAAGGFCRQLVRRVVALVRDVAAGRSPPEKVDRVLGEDLIDGPEGVPPAPAHPLVLTDVISPGLTVAVDADAAASARDIYDQRRTERRTGARVAGQIADGVAPE
jgi:tRNA pseudouridine38-40 synthase